MYTQTDEKTIRVADSNGDATHIYNLHLVGGEWQKFNGEVVELPDDVQWLTDEDKQDALAEDIRGQRDSLLTELDKLVMNPLRWAELDNEQQQEVAVYRQNLLDVPQQEGFPTEVVWPELTIDI